MYTREEAKKLKEQFWTNFGQFMTLALSEEGSKINWVNYKTGLKHVYFRMDADNKTASIYISITHPDEGIRALIFEQFGEFKTLLQANLHEEWTWDEVYFDEQQVKTSRIGIQIAEKTSIFKPEDWPKLISFFKPRIIALDRFWTDAKYTFDIFN